MRSLTMQTCPFIYNVEKMSGPKRSIKITDHFMGTSANVIYCITCTYCKKLHMGETGRRLGDRFREHLHDVEMTVTHPNQSPDILISLIILYSLMQFSAFSYIQAVRKAAKHLNKNLSSKSALLIPTVSTSAFHSTNLFLFSRHNIPFNSVAPFSAYKPTHNPQFLQPL